MDIKTTHEKYSEVFKRKEVIFYVDHMSSGTPPLYEVRKALAENYSVNVNGIYIIKLVTLTGTNRTKGIAEIYEDPEKAKDLIPEHVQKRNLASRNEKS